MAPWPGPVICTGLWTQTVPRFTGGARDELGYPLLDAECPWCTSRAMIINEWDAAECTACAWREFGPDSPRAVFRDWEAGRPGRRLRTRAGAR